MNESEPIRTDVVVEQHQDSAELIPNPEPLQLLAPVFTAEEPKVLLEAPAPDLFIGVRQIIADADDARRQRREDERVAKRTPPKARARVHDPKPDPSFGFFRIDDADVDEVPDGYSERWQDRWGKLGITRLRIMRGGTMWMRISVQHKDRAPNQSEMRAVKDCFAGPNALACEIDLGARERLPTHANVRTLFVPLEGTHQYCDLRNPTTGVL